MTPEAAPERIEVAKGTSMTIGWDDGTESTYSAAQLRGACQCAECREPAGQKQIETVLAGSEPVTIIDARLVGGYAINLVFGPDGHSTGIYPFPALHALAAAASSDPS